MGCRAPVAEGGAGEKGQLLDLTLKVEVTGVDDRLDVGERGVMADFTVLTCTPGKVEMP